MIKKILFPVLLLFVFFGAANAQEKRPYQYPEDPQVLQKVKDWQELKFGLFMHWGTYSQWGIVESWSICPEDRAFTSVRPEGSNYFEYVKKYENLITTFNPVKFDPDKWAKAAKEAGMKYVVFTTKHHDGFNMFDTRYSDYKITAEACPFSSNPKANVSKEVFNSFRNEGFMTGAYYSITDWHHNDYWWDYFPPFDRKINYSAKKYPEKWQRFNQFLYDQLNELTSGEYGKLDLLWFDLCGISNEGSPDWNRLATMTRKNQPGIMMIGRNVRGQYENYITPEQKVPEEALDYPWETCMTMGRAWSYREKDDFKSVHELVQLLVGIVSRGGNFLLNVGPGPDGDFHPQAYERLKGIGEWMKVNGEAIYGTKTLAPYHEEKLAFTQKGNYAYAFYLPAKDEKQMPATIAISSVKPVKGSRVFLLGYQKPLKWHENGTGFTIEVPASLQKQAVCENAWTLKFQINQ